MPPLPNAQVYVTWRNGTRDELPRYTDEQGRIMLSDVEKGNYGFTVIWKDEIVLETPICRFRWPLQLENTSLSANG